MKLIGTRMTPSRAVAKDSTANCQQLWDSKETRSPLVMPSASRAAAVRPMTASNSAKVRRVSPSTIASLSGKRFAVRIGIAIADSDPNRMYALVEARGEAGGVYRSDDAGANWKRSNGEQRIYARGSDFACVRVDPTNKD